MSREAVWHVTSEQASAYAGQALPEPDSWSVELHLEVCTPCARRVSDAVRAGAAGPVLRDVRAGVLAAAGDGLAAGPARAPAARVGAPEPNWAERLAWAAGPALGRSWLLSLALVTATVVLLARLADATAARPLLLVAAPLLPVAGVAASYGRHIDPLYETVAATPAGGLRLLLIRSGCVLAVCVPLLTVAGLLMPARDATPGPVAWLLPGLALTLFTLIAGSYIGCLRAAAAATTVWLLLLTAATVATEPHGADMTALVSDSFGALSGGPAQALWAAAAVLCGGLLALRRPSFDRPERL